MHTLPKSTTQIYTVCTLIFTFTLHKGKKNIKVNTSNTRMSTLVSFIMCLSQLDISDYNTAVHIKHKWQLYIYIAEAAWLYPCHSIIPTNPSSDNLSPRMLVKIISNTVRNESSWKSKNITQQLLSVTSCKTWKVYSSYLMNLQSENLSLGKCLQCVNVIPAQTHIMWRGLQTLVRCLKKTGQTLKSCLGLWRILTI